LEIEGMIDEKAVWRIKNVMIDEKAVWRIKNKVKICFTFIYIYKVRLVVGLGFHRRRQRKLFV